MGSELAFKLNDIYDPYYTGVGHQPYYHDQLAAVYGQYLVLSVEFIWTFTNPSADGIGIGVLMNGSTQGTTTITAMAPYQFTERPNACLKVLNNTGSQVTTVRQKVSLPSLEGVSLNEFVSNDNYRANYGASPNKKFFVRAAAANLAASATASVQYNIELLYHVRSYSRILPGDS
jgi:hypothetical protein